ncbi:EF-hand domain-containing protein [Streptomyces sp. NBC_00249]|uniref:EF-hand domain-containing protein n=1 Tax=Streptomyces sp. NBC_00249 TaxID=2975690 RepID=UPI00224D6659|nr:EF-hand domain-containing protein [Streptomyces sp. NBC_00249]MCX5193322.1 EF-hand domain-containing protein [Streptomyces sp. NBC_00249]
MTADLLRRKFEHRFDLLDTDRDGYISQADFTALADRLIAGVGEPADSPKSRALHDSKAHYWTSMTRLVPAEGGGRVSRDAFVTGLAQSPDRSKISDMVRPSVEADLALADRDDDGVVDMSEFKKLYGAIGVPAAEAEEIFRTLDRDGNGELTLDEWLEAAMEFFTSTNASAPGNRILGRV